MKRIFSGSAASRLRASFKYLRTPLAFGLAALAIGGTMAAPAQAASPDVVISQVYGGGGNTGAPFKNDYIELFNRGTSAVSLSGLSLQYASASGTGNFGSSASQTTELPAVVLQPGQYFLVQEAGGTTGAALPNADVVDATPINLSGTAGKVALVSGTSSLGCNGSSTACGADASSRIIDLVGYGSANYSEGAPAPAPSNTLAVSRAAGGCTDSDNNASDFATTAPAPRNSSTLTSGCTVVVDATPTVASTSPAKSEANVALDKSVSITFSEAVTADGSAFRIQGSRSGVVNATVSGNGTTFTIDPSTNFAPNETVTVTVFGAQVRDSAGQVMSGDYSFSFTTLAPPPRISEIQGASHVSPFNGQTVAGVTGVVTAKRSNGFYLQDTNGDGNDATSEAIFVFTSSAPTVNISDLVSVNGRVSEFRPGGSGSTNLSTTQISASSTRLLMSNVFLPAATIIGEGGRKPPTETIEDDVFGSVESGGAFDPAQDGIDFYESLEGMRVQVNNAVAVGPTSDFGEIPVVGAGFDAGVRTPSGGIVIRPDDFNPERILLDDVLAPTPDVNVGDGLVPVSGVIDYSFGNFKLLVTQTPVVIAGGLQREVVEDGGKKSVSIATFNVENLDPTDGPAKFDALAQLIVNNLKAPDLIALEEVQDNTGAARDGIVDANVTLNTLIASIQAAGGPTYQYRQINPVDGQDGGEPGGNIRVAFLFRTDRGLEFVDRAGGDSTTPVVAVPANGSKNVQLSVSPGRIDPLNPAFQNSRKPLVGEFRYRGETLFVIANHFNSKGGDQPLFGRFQPPTRSSETQRHAQAQIVNDFVDSILALDANANIIVLGDINDFQFSQTMDILEGGVLHNLIETLPIEEQYSYVFEGNSQALDHILLSDNLFRAPFVYDVVHVNSEFADQVSDHDPQVVQFNVQKGHDKKDKDKRKFDKNKPVKNGFKRRAPRVPEGEWTP